MEHVSDRDRVLAGDTTLDSSEPVTCAASIDSLEFLPQRTRWLCEQLGGVVSGARQNLNARETQKLGEFITEFQDIFATKGDDYGRHRHRRRPSYPSAPSQIPADQAGRGERDAERHMFFFQYKRPSFTTKSGILRRIYSFSSARGPPD